MFEKELVPQKDEKRKNTGNIHPSNKKTKNPLYPEHLLMWKSFL